MEEETVAGDKLYHMCQKTLWEEALASGSAYYPPTFEKDGYFTHATAVPARLLQTANHFYRSSKGDWICVELSSNALKRVGISTRYEEPKAVGETQVDGTAISNEWQCPHIFGGIPASLPGIVTNTYAMKRSEDGSFVSIEGLVE